MKVLCIYNDPANIPDGTSSDFDYGLELQKEYLVMGMILSEKSIWYLIDEGDPSCYPYQLFQVTDASISQNWHFKLYNEDDNVFPFGKNAILGYYELCFDENHYKQIVLREQEALKLYFKRKIELEKSLEI